MYFYDEYKNVLNAFTWEDIEKIAERDYDYYFLDSIRRKMCRELLKAREEYINDLKEYIVKDIKTLNDKFELKYYFSKNRIGNKLSERIEKIIEKEEKLYYFLSDSYNYKLIEYSNDEIIKESIDMQIAFELLDLERKLILKLEEEWQPRYGEEYANILFDETITHSYIDDMYNLYEKIEKVRSARKLISEDNRISRIKMKRNEKYKLRNSKLQKLYYGENWKEFTLNDIF